MAEGPSIGCPVCGGHLTFHLVGNLRIGICDACGGAWFGSGQLDSLVTHGSAALDVLIGMEPAGPHTQHADGQAKCPLCNTPLQSTTYPSSPPVHASACYQCGGIFLDADSIQALDAASQQKAGTGASTFGHHGNFGTVPPVPQGPAAPTPMPVPQAQYPSAPPQIAALSSSFYQNRQYYGPGPGMGYMQPGMGYPQQSPMGMFGTIVAADVVGNVVSNLLGMLF